MTDTITALLKRLRPVIADRVRHESGRPGDNLHHEMLDDLDRVIRDGEDEAAKGGMERVRHLKRGTEYEVLGEAEAQVSRGMRINTGSDKDRLYRHLHEGAHITIYRSLDNGKLWCRFPDEFRDGRFVTVEPPPARDDAEAR